MRNAVRLGIVTSATVVLVFVGGASAMPARSAPLPVHDGGSACALASGCPAGLPAAPIVEGRPLLTAG